MIVHRVAPPLADNAQTAIVDSIEAVLYDHYAGHVGHIQTIAAISGLVQEYRS